MNIKGSETERNILGAFAGESQARNKYSFFASKAKKEGFVQISNAFEETANQEKEHAKRLFKTLEGGSVELTATFPAGVVGSTADNLKEAAAGERFEWEEMYPGFADTAKKEGFDKIADMFTAIGIAEKQHEKRYLGFLSNIENGTVFRKAAPIEWRCINCGYVCEGLEAPELCPACAHPQAHFEILSENW